MRALITGSNGLLGTKLIELLAGRRDIEVVGTSRSACSNGHLGPFTFYRVDLTDASGADRVIRDVRPDVVIHTAAMTDVDGCEREPERAWRENVDAARNVAISSESIGAHLVHLSTEYVFDGRAGPYDEDDATNPLGVYGASKLASEAAVFEASPSAVAARTTVLFGWAPNVRPNFVTWAVDRMRQGENVRVVTDQVGSPTLADNLAEMVWALAADPGASGVFNTVGDAVIDRLSFALQMADVFGLDRSLVEPTDTPSLKQAAARPLRAGLRMDRFKARFPSVPVLDARTGLERLATQMARSLQVPAPVRAAE